MRKLWSLLGNTLSEIGSPEIRLILIIMIMYSISISGLYVKKEAETKRSTDRFEDNLNYRLNQKIETIVIKDREIDSLHGKIFEVQTQANNERILLLETLIKKINGLNK